ncbi:MAG: hypothetical protein AAFQ07_17735 [Chloroflexota bacterium]
MKTYENGVCMSVEVLWDDEAKTIVRFVYEGKWDWNDFYTQIDAANAMMDTVSLPCVSLIDMTKSSYLPPNAAIHIRNVIQRSMSHNNSGISVFLNAGMFVEMMIGIVSKINPDIAENTEWLYTDDPAEARQMARREVEKLHATQTG